MGASVLDVSPRGGGARREEAADGGGRSGTFNEGRGGGNMEAVLGFGLDAFWFWPLGVGRGGGAIRVFLLVAFLVAGDGRG